MQALGAHAMQMRKGEGISIWDDRECNFFFFEKGGRGGGGGGIG